MAELWIVEEPHTNPRIADLIGGNFALRRIASMRSASRIISMGTNPPQVLLLNLAKKTPLTELYGFVKSLRLKNSCCHILLCQKDPIVDNRTAEGLGIEVVAELEDAMRLSQHVDNIVRSLKWNTSPDMIRAGDMELELETSRLRFSTDNSDIWLTPKLNQLIGVLMQNQNRMVDRATLQTSAWRNVKVSERLLDTYLSRIRRILAKSQSCTIETHYGKGVMLRIGDL